MIDVNTTRKIAKLARIALKEGEAEVYAKELSGLLKWIEQLSEVDTNGVPALASISNIELRWRDDIVTDGGKQAEVLANATASAYSCFAVPKVIE